MWNGSKTASCRQDQTKWFPCHLHPWRSQQAVTLTQVDFLLEGVSDQGFAIVSDNVVLAG
jgi:hypothetical protein